MALDPNVALAESCVQALRTAWTAWKREEAPQHDSEAAYAQFVESIDFHVQAKPGRPAIIIVEVNDRRPGRSHLSSYEHQMAGGKVRLSKRELRT